VVVVSVARGRVNAGGIGFLCASDIVLADRSITCGLSELLFGLFPAMVLPFLIRRVGLQKANYLTLMTRPIGVDEALSNGLVDAVEDDAQALLRKHLLRLRRLSKPAIARYKSYLAQLTGEPERSREAALAANRDLFRNPEIQRNIHRYVTEAKFPWEP
jgi:polyketide biosynthesis enoyl-CoA hydratase PksH